MKITRLSCKGRKIGEQRVISKFAFLPTIARKSDEIRWLERVRILQTVRINPIATDTLKWTNEYFV
jgi:hypothetical protein